jgi:hypothetical protein
MKPKERANEIFKQYLIESPFNELEYYDENKIAKYCALILVNEILEGQYISIKLHEIEYWKKVKREINKL